MNLSYCRDLGLLIVEVLYADLLRGDFQSKGCFAWRPRISRIQCYAQFNMVTRIWCLTAKGYTHKMFILMGKLWTLGYLIFSQSDHFSSFFIVYRIVPNLCLDVSTWGCNPVGKWVITITQKCGTSTFGLSAYRVRSHFYIWDAGRERGPHGQQQRESWGGPGDDEGRRRYFTSP